MVRSRLCSRSMLAALAVLGVEALAPVAKAQPAESDAPPLEEKRPVPDYDGRPDEPTTAGEALLWVPRVALFPLYVVSEYVIRWPMRQVTVWAERNKVPEKVKDVLTWGPGDDSGVVPSALIDFGFRPSVGVYFFSDDWLYPNNAMRAHLAFGGPDYYRATAAFRHYVHRLDDDYGERRAQLRFEYERRADYRFWGLGADAPDANESAYTGQHIDGALSFRAGGWESSRIELFAGARDQRFFDRNSIDERTLAESVAAGRFALPPLFDDGYTVGRVGFDGALDSRPRRHLEAPTGIDFVSPPGSGLKLGLRAELAGGMRDSRGLGLAPDREEPLRYLRYGVTLGTFVDVLEQRTLGLQVMADFADSLDDAPVPFTELPSLGGDRPLRGFKQHRMLGDSTVAAVLDYRWPIWVWLDGTLHYGAGNAFGEHLDGFELELMKQSFGLGLRTTSERDHAFEMLVAVGTETIRDGGAPETFRFVFGTTAGF